MATAVAALPAAVAGCTLSGPEAEDGQGAAARRAGETDPDVALLDEVAGATETLVALYQSALQQHRDLRGDLRPLLAAHRAHAETLGTAAPPGDHPARRRTLARADTEVSQHQAAAVRELRAAERRSASVLLEATRRARSGAFARLLASMSAASAQHVQVLSGVGA